MVSGGSCGFMKPAVVAVSILVAIAGIAGCGESTASTKAARVKPPPVDPCSLLTAREVSRVLDVGVRVKRSRFACAFQGTRDQVFRAVVVSPQRLTAAARPAPFEASNGRIVQIAGRGYRGQVQNDAAAEQAASGLAQSHAQIVSGNVIVRLLVTYHTAGLRGVPQLREAATLADQAGKRLVRARALERPRSAGGDNGPDRLTAYRLCDRAGGEAIDQLHALDQPCGGQHFEHDRF